MLDATHLPDDISALQAMRLAREAAWQASEARMAHLSAELPRGREVPSEYCPAK